MSQLNGVIKIEEEGFADFEFKRGEVSIVITLDVIKCNDRWAEQDAAFRDDQGIIKGREEERRQASENFVHAVVHEWVEELKAAAAAGLLPVPEVEEKIKKAGFVVQRLSAAQVMRFHAEVWKACQRIKPFFSEDTGSAPSLPQPSGQVIYSE